MKKKDKEWLREKLKTTYELTERGKKTLLSHYTTGHFDDFLFFKHGSGSKIYDPDGNEYVDHAMALGPLILGHCPPVVVEASIKAIQKGSVHGIGHEYEIEFAELMAEAVPCAERVLFTNSGTEATMHALKCARAYTGKDKIAKFEGHYHGTHDYAQISGRLSTAGPAHDPESTPDYAGIPKCVLDNVLTLSMDQPETFEKLRRNREQLAAVIVEPVPLYCPLDSGDFLRELREVTKECNIVLIFDEVVTGFRIGYGGAQEYYGILPDIATYGKIIGGGFPVGAVAGKNEYMRCFDFKEDLRSRKKVFTTGTFGGNPVTCAAGIATLRFLRDNRHVYGEMEAKALRIKTEVEEYAQEIGFPLQIKGMGSYFVPYFFLDEIKKSRDTRWSSNISQFNILRKHMLLHGVNLAEIGTLFLSTAHSDEDCDKTIAAFKKSLDELL